MKTDPPLHAPALEDLSLFRQEVERLRGLSDDSREVAARLARLAEFPEKNPDILVETDIQGRVTYINLVAQSRFPAMWQEGFEHPLLYGMRDIVAGMAHQQLPYHVDEITLEGNSFERQVCYAHDHGNARIRVYIHDVTRRKQAERAIKNLARQVVHSHEEERRRLSRELHDEAGQALTALKLSLELLRDDPPAEVGTLNRKLAEAIGLVESTMSRVRVLAHELRPPVLDTLGLNLALHAYCRDFAQRTGLEIVYRGCELPNLAEVMNICLYRVLQEALTNVAKHADASAVLVELKQVERAVHLSIMDDGKGLNANEPPRQQGIGMMGMRERLELLGGHLEVQSKSGEGLKMIALLPLERVP